MKNRILQTFLIIAFSLLSVSVNAEEVKRQNNIAIEPLRPKIITPEIQSQNIVKAPDVKVIVPAANKNIEHSSSVNMHPTPQQAVNVQAIAQNPVQLKGKKVPADLANHIKSFKSNYESTLLATLQAAAKMNLTINSYNSTKGEIDASYKDRKRFYIVIVPIHSKMTLTRITPADGVYDIPAHFLNGLFSSIDEKLALAVK